jgi:ribose 5-phosphate isomerase B
MNPLRKVQPWTMRLQKRPPPKRNNQVGTHQFEKTRSDMKDIEAPEMSSFRVSIASDHAGFSLKQQLIGWLTDSGHRVDDLGPENSDRVDYPDFAHVLANRVAAGESERGILICGSGIGMSIAANKTAGVRAANCTISYQAEMTRRHNDANVLCIGERVVGPGLAQELVDVFLRTEFEGGRHSQRVDKIEKQA